MSEVHQQPAKLFWQIISGASPWFTGPVAFFASYWSAGVERFCQPPALVSHWLGGFAGSAPTLIVSQSTLSLDNIQSAQKKMAGL
jgi:hypothetical protein